MTILCYPACSTCKKAEKWLREQNLPYEYRDIVKENPTAEELRLWWAQSGLPLKKLFNTSGNAYKEGKLKDRLPGLSEEEQLALLSSNGMLIKRPILVSGKKVLVGFREADWAAALL